MGYHQAGFEVVGVDLAPQKHYPFEFYQADALEFLDSGGWKGFDAIHASPPCQGYSVMNNLPWLQDKEREYLILPVRERLRAIRLPYVIENVMGAAHGAKGLVKIGKESHGMKALWLCGTMFGLPFYRHRLFESSFFWGWERPKHMKHRGIILPGRNFGDRGHIVTYSAAEDARGKASWPNRRGTEAGSGLTVTRGSLASGQGDGAQKPGVGIGHAAGWRLAAEAMGINWMKREELTQAIPPAYTRFIGEQLLRVLRPAADAPGGAGRK